MKITSLSLLDLQLLVRRQALSLLLIVLLVLAAFIFLRQPHHQGDASPPDLNAEIKAMQQLRQTLLSPGEVAAAQQAFLDSAQAFALKTGRIDYAQETDSQSRLSRMSMRLPLSGPYADIRRLMSTSLQQHPALAIRQLSIERQTGEGSDSLVQATLTVEFLISEADR